MPLLPLHARAGGSADTLARRTMRVGVEFFFRREGHGGAVEQVVEVVVQETEDGLGCIQRATVLISHQQTRALMPFDALDQALGAEETEFFVAPDAVALGLR